MVGVTCMHIAAKYEEIYPPQLENFTYITDHAYKKDEIIQCEIEVLQSLDFDLTFSTPLRFLERYSRLANLSSYNFYMARYILELCLIDVHINKYTPALQAATSIFVANKLTKQCAAWSAMMISQTNISE